VALGTFAGAARAAGADLMMDWMNAHTSLYYGLLTGRSLADDRDQAMMGVLADIGVPEEYVLRPQPAAETGFQFAELLLTGVGVEPRMMVWDPALWQQAASQVNRVAATTETIGTRAWRTFLNPPYHDVVTRAVSDAAQINAGNYVLLYTNATPGRATYYVIDSITGELRPAMGVRRPATLYSSIVPFPRGFTPFRPDIPIPSDTLAAVQGDIIRSQSIFSLVESSPGPITSLPSDIPRASRLPNGRLIVYRGQNIDAIPSVSLVARSPNTLDTSVNLYNEMLNLGFQPKEIAALTGANIDAVITVEQLMGGRLGTSGNVTLEQFESLLNIDPHLGGVGIPTTRNPLIAAGFAGNSGVLYVIEYSPSARLLGSQYSYPFIPVPGSSNIINPSITLNQMLDEEIVTFNIIPETYFIGTLDINTLPGALGVNYQGAYVIKG
jgi:hypothetical protein